MLAGALVYGVRYTVPEYVCTVLVAAGVSMFALFKVRERLRAVDVYPHPVWLHFANAAALHFCPTPRCLALPC